MCEHVSLRAQYDRNSCVCGCRGAAIKNDYEGRCNNPSPMADELQSLCTTDDEFVCIPLDLRRRVILHGPYPWSAVANCRWAAFI